ncbi:hypothetical protein DPM19_11015 [Actinomadura craniellae]|uniref:SecDF P1 head subdomain domain-containing protein n=1 Tax=Actinomadura craniellae TaxID=2231787 RepID=A0A365H8E9_9ACTN|nr:hypothetical protein [Actinomadura craniellae]RAY15236.1 hypothetical protein DPM19_11015 [Actinomadura craniellae]
MIGYEPAPRNRNGLVIGLVFGVPVLLAVVVLGVLLAVQVGDDEPEFGPATLRQPIQLRQVSAVNPPPCTGGAAASADDGQCYVLGNGMTVRQVADLKVTQPGLQQGDASWALLIKLRPADVQPFADLTRRVSTAPAGTPANRLAILVGDGVVSAPSVTSVLTSGDVQISGTFTRDEAYRLAAQITGSA